MAEVPLSVTREFMRESWDTRRANQRRSQTLSARGLEALEDALEAEERGEPVELLDWEDDELRDPDWSPPHRGGAQVPDPLPEGREGIHQGEGNPPDDLLSETGRQADSSGEVPSSLTC